MLPIVLIALFVAYKFATSSSSTDGPHPFDYFLAPSLKGPKAGKLWELKPEYVQKLREALALYSLEESPTVRGDGAIKFVGTTKAGLGSFAKAVSGALDGNRTILMGQSTIDFLLRGQHPTGGIGAVAALSDVLDHDYNRDKVIVTSVFS